MSLQKMPQHKDKTKLINRTYLGLLDLGEDLRLQMNNNILLSARFWNTGKPNDLNRIEDCVHIRSDSALWNDRSCETSLQWICEKRL